MIDVFSYNNLTSSKNHIMNKCKIFLLFTFYLFCLLFSIYCRADQIKISGLDSQPEIQAYLDKQVLANYQNSKDKDVYPLEEEALKALKAKGYYAAETHLEKKQDVTILILKLNPIYKISQVKVSGYHYSKPLKIGKNDVLDAEKVLSAQEAILNSIKSRHCYYSLSIYHEITLDHFNRSAILIYYVTIGPSAKFGKTSMVGLKTVNETYIKSLETYRPNQCWNMDKVEETKTAFMKTGLFSYIKVELPPVPNSQGIVDFSYNFTEKAPRSIRFGISHQTDEGFGFQGKWKHRNLYGSAEGLALELKISYLIQSFKTDYTSPHFFGFNRSLVTGILAERKNTDAFEELNLNANAYLKNKHTKIITSSIGVTAGISEVKDESDENKTQTFGLVSFPGMLSIDTRDKPLDSHKGIFSQIQIEPFTDLLGNSSPFLRLNFSNSIYFALYQDSIIDPVLAFRTNIGSIFGHKTDDIPAPKRYYAGGGNSIRGYEFQRVGPFKDGDPAGGRSLIELSSELRVKITNTIGIVSFVDAGNVYSQSVPEFNAKGLSVGVGAGLRYYTDFGPIRFDIATPLNNYDNNRKRIQFYVSLGQAF